MVHYYSENQVSEFSPVKIKAVLRGKDLEFYTAGGVFPMLPEKLSPYLQKGIDE